MADAFIDEVAAGVAADESMADAGTRLAIAFLLVLLRVLARARDALNLFAESVCRCRMPGLHLHPSHHALRSGETDAGAGAIPSQSLRRPHPAERWLGAVHVHVLTIPPPLPPHTVSRSSLPSHGTPHCPHTAVRVLRARGERSRCRCPRAAPDYSRMFVRGIGWIHVGARPNRPRAAARAYVLSTVRVGLYMLRACLHGNPCTQAHLASATRRLRAYVGYAFDSTLGYPGEGWGPRRCVYLETPCVLHNPNGLASDDRARSAYLRSLRAAFPVVALVETHCKPTQEALWAREWGSGQTFWSSLDAPVAQRGVALLFADTVDVADASAQTTMPTADCSLSRGHSTVTIRCYL